MTENKRRTGIITLEEARERFNDYYNKRNKNIPRTINTNYL